MLLTSDEPRFVWTAGTFKNVSVAASDTEKAALISYGTSLARVLLAGTQDVHAQTMVPSEIRALLLRTAPFVALQGLLNFCWTAGIPVAQLRAFPLKKKLMCAMAVRVNDRYAILLARESRFSAQIAYYIAHELGHIALGHLSMGPALVDAQDPLRSPDHGDSEERAADRFALEILTGTPEPNVLPDASSFSARALSDAVIASAHELQIEPGTLALCLGHNTGRWDKVNAAMDRIYEGSERVGTGINRFAISQIRSSGAMSEENDEYVCSTLGVMDV